MRIGDLAKIAGTTPRAVRHYHRAGVLAEPARRPNGYREYTAADVARLLRVRWLLGAGLSLRQAREALDADAAGGRGLERELEAALEQAAAERERLDRQERVLRGVLAQVRAGRSPSAVVPEVTEGLGDVAAAVGAGGAGWLAAERRAVEMLAHRGVLDEGAQRLLADTLVRLARVPEDAARLSDLAARMEALAGRDPRTAAAEVDAAAALLDQVLGAVGLEALAGAVTPAGGVAPDADAPAWLEALLPDPAQRAVLRTVLARRTP
ncbi:MerR family transcriptional regulator [Puerhibacterium puerhi]|uniref:MerR family transcriptional regulator n=1 Tax=Puerhibacterium puerhi TaxID=2692623 RepID=UPI00135B2741|nr:MerR family transcriptional regulator [Puerhibacterium puerhi]